MHQVIVRAAKEFIDILDSYGRCIASHKRVYSKRTYITDPSHMPPFYYSVLDIDCYDGDAFRKWAMSIGENASLFIDALLSSKDIEQHSYKSCMSVLQLSKKYSAKRFNAACGHALETEKISYYTVQNYLKHH